MLEYRYTSNNSNIVRIENALKTCLTGQGFAIIFEITKKKIDKDRSTLIFKSERTTPLNPMEFFEFGLIVGRDYIPKD